MGDLTDVDPKSLLGRLREKLAGDDAAQVITRAVTGVYLVRVTGVALSFATQLLLARVLGLAEYGSFVYAIVWMNFLALISKLGFENTLVRYVAAYRAENDWGRLRGLMRRTVQCVLVASLLVIGAAVVVVFALWERLGASQAGTLVTALILVPVVALTGLRQAALRGLKQVVRAEVPDNIVRPTLFSAALLLAEYAGGASVLATRAMALNAAVLAVVFLIGTVWLVRALSAEVPRAEPTYADREWFGVALPFLLVSAAYLLLTQADLIMVGALLGSRDAGMYGAALRIAQLVGFGIIAANSIAGPLVSEQHSAGRFDELRRTVALSARGGAACTIPTFLFLAVFGEYVLGFFGPYFVDAYRPLIILLCGQLLFGLAGPVTFLMMMTGHQKRTAYIISVSAVFNVVLNGAFIPWLGITGAALSTAVTSTVANAVMILYVMRTLRINPTVFARAEASAVPASRGRRRDRVLFLTRDLNTGGAQRQLAVLARALASSGNEPAVALFYPGGRWQQALEEAGVPIVRLRKRGRWEMLRFYCRVTQLVRQRRPQILHSYMAGPNVLAVLIKPFCRGVKVVWGVRASRMEGESYDRLTRLLFFIERRLARYADLIIGNSFAGRDYHTSRGFPLGRFVVVPNGIDTDEFFPDREGRERARADWGVSADALVVGVVGRLDPMKDHETFLQAAAQLVRDRPALRFVCVGDGPESERRRLARKSEALGLSSSRLLWCGSREDMRSVYSGLDILCSPSAFGEGFSNAIGEAMACAVPCVVSDVGDSRRVVADCGIVVEPRSALALAAGVRELLRLDTRARRNLGERARAYIVHTFAVDRLLAQTLEHFEAVVGARSWRQGRAGDAGCRGPSGLPAVDTRTARGEGS